MANQPKKENSPHQQKEDAEQNFTTAMQLMANQKEIPF